MPNRPRSTSWYGRPAAVFLLAVGVAAALSGCTSNAEDAAPVPSPVATSTTRTTVSTVPTTVETPPLVPPTVVASAPPPETYEPPPVVTEPVLADPTDPAPCVGCTAPPAPPAQPVEPAEPALPPPSPLDSRGFPLGTTCGPVSCTSPDGLIFVNPDAVPNFGGQLAPPELQLPSTGSGGGPNTAPR